MSTEAQPTGRSNLTMWYLLSTFQWTTSNSVAVNHKVSVTTRPKARTWMCVSDVRGSEITNINTCSSPVIPQWFRKKQSRKKKKKLHKRGLIKADLPRAHDIHELHSASHKHTPSNTHTLSSVKEEVVTVWQRDYAGFVEQILLNASDP